MFAMRCILIVFVMVWK